MSWGVIGKWDNANIRMEIERVMHVGFIVTRSPSEEDFKTFLKFMSFYKNEKTSIYLLGNGVYCGRKWHFNSLHKILEKSTIYASLNDLKARGIQQEDMIKDIIIFEDFDLVVRDIMENLDQILSF